MKYEQPPIGAIPHWHKYHERIKELNGAITRYIEHLDKQSHSINTKDIETYELLHKWAFDLSELCKLEANLLRKDRKGSDNQ